MKSCCFRGLLSLELGSFCGLARVVVPCLRLNSPCLRNFKTNHSIVFEARIHWPRSEVAIGSKLSWTVGLQTNKFSGLVEMLQEEHMFLVHGSTVLTMPQNLVPLIVLPEATQIEAR